MTKASSSKKKPNQPKSSKTLWWGLGGVAGLVLIVLLAWSIAGETPVDNSIGYGDVTVAGTSLPFFDATASDPSIGLEAPTVSGADWEGNPYSIAPDGRPKIVVMLAHWCPHCEAEVPRIQAWLDGGGLPEGVDLYGITVLTDPLRPNFPPQTWLEGHGWTSPTIMDDEARSAATAFGLASTPTYLVLDGDNVNLGRFSGEIGSSGLDTLALMAQASVEG